MFNSEDLELIAKKGISTELIQEQLDRFKTGFPYLKIKSVAKVGDGIVRLTDAEVEECEALWAEFQQSGGTVEKFVPASGAASRMFKNVFEFVSANKPAPETDFEKKLFDGIENFAFYKTLDANCEKAFGKGVKALIAEGRYVDVAKGIIYPEGMNYGALPKALLQFHKVNEDKANTPLEEHLEEGAQYASDLNKNVNIHFTVSPEHRKEFEKLIAVVVPEMEKEWGVKYNVSMSEQKSSTDTIAVNMDNTPYRENGKLLFRPAGHGALIENLNEIDADVVFVKNIDNVVPRKLREITVTYKKVLGGFLVKLMKQISAYAEKLEAGCTGAELQEMLKYAEEVLSISNEAAKDYSEAELAEYLKKKFNRPIRVCGVVRNDGEPGGGPYLAFNEDGTASPQILEAAQIDSSKPEAVELMKSGTHFNPVDLVCYVKTAKGGKFNLKEYVDKNTGLISEKSKSGVVIKALELPGLWNGSMSDWTSVFVEVPIETFNPVKTVNDLLRPQHQG